MSHMHWTVICKTPGCEKRHSVGYIAYFPYASPIVLPDRMPVQGFRCDSCDKVYDYGPEDIMFYPGEAPEVGRT
jgi:hypothetical protein